MAHKFRALDLDELLGGRSFNQEAKRSPIVLHLGLASANTGRLLV